MHMGIPSYESKKKRLPTTIEVHDGEPLTCHPMKYEDRQVPNVKLDYQDRHLQQTVEFSSPYGKDWKDPMPYVGDEVAFVTRDMFDANDTQSRRGTVIDLTFERLPGSTNVKRTIQII